MAYEGYATVQANDEDFKDYYTKINNGFKMTGTVDLKLETAQTLFTMPAVNSNIFTSPAYYPLYCTAQIIEFNTVTGVPDKLEIYYVNGETTELLFSTTDFTIYDKLNAFATIDNNHATTKRVIPAGGQIKAIVTTGATATNYKMKIDCFFNLTSYIAP